MQFLPVDPVISKGLSLLQLPKYLRTVVNSLSYIGRLIRCIGGCDAVHVFTASYYSFTLVALPALIAARLAGKPAILHYHDGRAEDHLSRFPLSRRAMKLASAIVVPSAFLVVVFGRFGFTAEAIPNTLDPREIPYRVRAKLRPRFLHNRGMEAVYNVECTLRAFEIIQRTYPHASLRLAHDGTLRPKLEQQARALGLRNVEFTGAVDPKVMGTMYDEADLFLTSADADNMPGSVLECFAAGLPVIATAAGGTAWLIRDRYNGMLAPCGDSEALARAALLLLSDEELAQQLASNASRECRQFYWDRVKPQWLRLYSRLLPEFAVHRDPVNEAAVR